MRRVKTHNSNNTPVAVFTVGAKQSARNQMSQASKYDDQELRGMQRSPKKQDHKGSLFSVLTQQLFWENTSHQS